MRFLFCLSIIAGFLSVSTPALAASMEVMPETLSIHQASDSQSRLTLFVRNTGERSAMYQVLADDYNQLIVARPAEFRLDAGEGRLVDLVAANLPEGKRETTLSVLAQDIGQDLRLPKTEKKVSLSLDIAPAANMPAPWLLPISVGFILGSLGLWLFVMIRAKRRPIGTRLLDAWQEQRAATSWIAWLGHYWRVHRLVIISLCCVLVSAGLLAWSVAAEPRQGASVTSASEQQYLLVLRGPTFEQSYEITVPAGEPVTAFTALQKAAERYTIPLSYQPPTELGVFVTGIADVANGTDGRYWVYEINDRQVPLAADRSFLSPGDRLVWKFTLPEG